MLGLKCRNSRSGIRIERGMERGMEYEMRGRKMGHIRCKMKRRKMGRMGHGMERKMIREDMDET